MNLFVALTSLEMIALSRILSIIHLFIVVPCRYLAGKSHEFRDYNWGALDMSRVIDTLHQKLLKIKKQPDLMLDPIFMDNIFLEYRNELPPFQEYWNMLFKEKQMKVVALKDGTKVVHFARVRKEAFTPSRKSSKDTTKTVLKLIPVAVEALLKELLDVNKATYKYLSISGSEYSYKHASDERKMSLIGVHATNDQAESVLGGTTAGVQRFGRISLGSAGAVSDMKRNSFLHRKSTSKTDTKSTGIFHGFDPDVRDAIIEMGIKDAPTARRHNNKMVERLNQVRLEKEEIAKRLSIEKQTEQFIEAEYYLKMYDSAACWKGDKRIVTSELKKLSSDSAKYRALKENISIRVKGCGWDWAKTPWSQDGKKKSVFELAKHLQYIIGYEKKLEVPAEPPLNLPQRPTLATLGIAISDVASLDQKYASNVSELKKAATRTRREREIQGTGSMYSQLQPFSRPEVSELVGKRIDVLFSVDIDPWTKSLRWCQGEVIGVVDGSSKPTVTVEWDPTPDIAESENGIISDQVLLPTKWNKDNNVGAWRMDVDVEVLNEEEEDDDDELGDIEYDSDGEAIAFI
jgi:hypothetical protein